MNNHLKSVLWTAAFASGLMLSPALWAATSVIDVLVVYTKGTADAYGGDPTTRINQLLQVSNQIYQDSGVNIELRLATTLAVNYTDNNLADTALNDITFAKHPAFAEVAAVREQAGADMVILYRPFKAEQASCGLAWINGQGSNGDFSAARHKKFMFAQIAINSCGDFVTAHELGHNMGLRHSRKQDGSGGSFPYALGYGEVNGFTTIMAYQSEFNVDYWAGKLYKFSNPDLSCKGRPCGVSRNDPINGADARTALNIAAPQIANFYSAGAKSASSSSAKARFAARSVAAFSATSGVRSSTARGSFAFAPSGVVLAVVAAGESSSSRSSSSQSNRSNSSATRHWSAVNKDGASHQLSAVGNSSASSYLGASRYTSLGKAASMNLDSSVASSSRWSSAASASSLAQVHEPALAVTALGE